MSASWRKCMGSMKNATKPSPPWFIADTLHVRRLEVNALPAAALRKHPYLDYRQAKAIEQLRKQKSRLSGWENLQLIEEFTDTDKKRLTPYLSFK